MSKFTKCPECGEPLQATAQIYLSDVELDERGVITSYRIAFDGPEPELNTTMNSNGALNLDEPDGYSIYCPNDHPFDLEKAKGHPKVETVEQTRERERKRDVPLNERIGIYMHSGGVVWADKLTEANNDYKKLAFMAYDTLDVTPYTKRKDFLDHILEHAATYRKGERCTIAGNMTITLGVKATREMGGLSE